MFILIHYLKNKTNNLYIIEFVESKVLLKNTFFFNLIKKINYVK